MFLTIEIIKQVYKRSSVLDNHLSRPIVTNRLKRPTYRRVRAALFIPILVLLQVGFTQPTSRLAAGELLPRLSILTTIVAVYFCCTILRIAPTRRYLAPCSMELRLSSCKITCDYLAYLIFILLSYVNTNSFTCQSNIILKI